MGEVWWNAWAMSYVHQQLIWSCGDKWQHGNRRVWLSVHLRLFVSLSLQPFIKSFQSYQQLRSTDKSILILIPVRSKERNIIHWLMILKDFYSTCDNQEANKLNSRSLIMKMRRIMLVTLTSYMNLISFLLACSIDSLTLHSDICI